MLVACGIAGGPRPEGSPRPVRILPFGDSLTSGEVSPDAVGGYRAQLAARLDADGISYELSGSLANGPMAQNHHDGVAGDTVALMRARIDDRMRAARPDVVIVHAGTNDAIAGSPTLVADLGDLLDDILRHGASVVVCTPIATAGEAREAILLDLATALPAMVTARRAQGHDIVLADLRAVCPDTTGFELDGIHPGPLIYADLGDAIYDEGVLAVLGRAP